MFIIFEKKWKYKKGGNSAKVKMYKSIDIQSKKEQNLDNFD